MKKRIALVLGSGGARGYAHIGVIEELESLTNTATGFKAWIIWMYCAWWT